MRGIITTIDGGTVDVQIIEPAAHYAVLISLLDAAGEHSRAVKTTTHHGRTGFRVPLDLAERAGLLDTEQPEQEAEPELVKAPAKKATARKTAAKPVDAASESGGEQ